MVTKYLLLEVPFLDDVGRQRVSLVRVAGGARELAEVEAEPKVNVEITHFWQFGPLCEYLPTYNIAISHN
jgi:hypothetical protein